MSALAVLRAAPQTTVQDMGRPGWLAEGLSRGGAADRQALLEAAALLGQEVTAALEIAGGGAAFRAEGPLRIALTGAPMRAAIGERALVPHAAHRMAAGEVLTLAPAVTGVYGYLSLGGGLALPEVMGSRSTHLAARLGGLVAAGEVLPAGPDPAPGAAPACLDPPDRFAGGTLRVVPGAQTGLWPEAERARFEATRFTRDRRGNRQGVRLAGEGPAFGAAEGLTILSEVIVPGDIQMTGDGAPFVLMPECQTTGGYPRIGSVLPDDLPVIAQAAPGATIRFRFLTLAEARAQHLSEAQRLGTLRRAVRPLTRDPRDMADLLRYQLVSGAVTGAEEP